MLEALWITFAFSLGLLVKTLGMPPLVGYLAAGFAISGLAAGVDITAGDLHLLQHISHVGVLLLLFTVGLKLKVRSLLSREVIGGGLLHFAITCLLFTPGLYLLLDVDWETALLLAVALSFPSTVLAAKVLEGKRELRAFHGRVAIGILVIQDLIALAVVSVTSGTSPSAWALLVFCLPLLRPLLYRLLDASGHDELLVLLGLLLALVLGGYGFESVGLSSELGALVFGAMLANHPRAAELSKSLWSIKEVFLVGFFLLIGMGGLPDMSAILFALGAAAALPLKAALFFFLLLVLRLRVHSSFLTSLSLTNYSEFGLIVASIALPEWLVPLAIAVSLSFLLSAPLNRIAHPLYERVAHRLLRLESDHRHPDEQPVSLHNTQVLVVGMGRTGTSAYDRLSLVQPHLMGLDSDPAKTERHVKEGRNVLFADAEDTAFWQHLEMSQLQAVILSMSDIEGKLIAARMLRSRGFEGYIIAHTMFADEASQIREAGASEAYLTLNETGVALAGHITDYTSKPARL